MYGRLHTPSGHGVNIAGFSSGAAAKAALASVVLALAILQAVTAMGLYGRSGGPGLGPCTAGRSASRS